MTQSRPPYRIQRPPLDPCVLRQFLPARIDYGAPPPNLSETRRQLAQRVLDRSFSEVMRRFMTPSRAEESEERRSVRLWDLYEISVAADGTDLQAHLLSDDPDASRCLVRVDLTRPIGAYGWTGAFDPVLVDACRELSLNPRILPGPTGDHIRSVMGRTFRRCIEWKRLRRSVLAFLRPDPLIFSLTKRVFEDTHGPIESFNWVTRHLRELSRIGIERPRLLPFLQIVSRTDRGSPLENFESLMREAGLTPSARRKLERWGWEPFSMATEFGLSDNCEETIARYANLLDRLQVMDAPHIMFTELVTRGAGLFAPDWYVRAMLNEVRRLEEDFPTDPYPIDYEDAEKWLASGPSEPDPNQQRAGWDWIAAQAWNFKLANDAAAIVPWTVPCEAFVQGAYRVIPLRNLAELREEAMVMHNCLDTLADDCARGKLAVFSIRDLTSSRRLACFSLARVETPAFWQLLQVAGKANCEVSLEIRAVAMATVTALNIGQ